MFNFLNIFKKNKEIEFGAVPEEFDVNDFRYEEICSASPPVDWERGFSVEDRIGKIPVKNQKKSGSCVGQSWSYYAGVLEAIEIGIYRDFSARFIYSQIYLPSRGAYIKDGAKILTKQGAIPSALFPDKDNEIQMRMNDDLTKDLKSIALVYKKGNYLSVPHNDIDYIASVIQENNGCVTGVFLSRDGWRNAWVRPPLKGEKKGGHAVYLIGFKKIKGRKYIIGLNSWSENWGDRGKFYLGEDYVNSGNLFNLKILKDLPSEVKRPKKKPQYRFNVNIKWGDKGEEVKKLQECLAYEKCFLYPEFTGNFYGFTLRAVKCFQAKYGIEPIAGFVGPKTRAKLNEIYGK